MSNIAFTLVHNDMVILEFWAKYYSRYFDELLVFLSGTKDMYKEKLEEMGVKYNLKTERIESADPSPQESVALVRQKQKELLKKYKWVLWCDPDEIITTDPNRYKDLKDFMEKFKGKWTWCIGYEILKEEDESWLDYSKPILRQRRSWLKDDIMNKVPLSRVPLSWGDGFHFIDETKSIYRPGMKNKGLYLLHFKHADYNAPNRDYVAGLRPMFAHVLENLQWREPIPEELRDLL